MSMKPLLLPGTPQPCNEFLEGGQLEEKGFCFFGIFGCYDVIADYGGDLFVGEASGVRVFCSVLLDSAPEVDLPYKQHKGKLLADITFE